MENTALSSGARIAHYEIDRRIGAGGMGEVFRAMDLTLERAVALKILPPSLLSDTERVRRFVQEAKSASALNHPNIVTIYEIGQAAVEGQADGPRFQYMAMELIQGQTLREMIYADTPLDDVLAMLAQAADGLAKAHGAGIVHRDLKPDNIMVSVDGYAKVVDFGLAKLTEKKQQPAGSEEEHPLTQSGMVMGTVGYMSPEQVEGTLVYPSSDIFSFGCILYEAAARKKPFQSDMAIDTMHKIIFSEPPALVFHNPDAPEELQLIIDRCLKKKPEDRYGSMREVAAAIRSFIGSAAGAPAPPRPLTGRSEFPHLSGSGSRPKIEAPVEFYDDEVTTPGWPRRILSIALKSALLGSALLLIYVGATLPDLSVLQKDPPEIAVVRPKAWAVDDELPSVIKSSTVKAIDSRFFERRGLGTKDLAAALKSLTTSDRILYLPSPIAVLTARRIYSGDAGNPVARLRAWMIAGSMQSELSHKRILELYLNVAQYGEMTGVADASQRYFRKPARGLTRSEAAMLTAAALTKDADPAMPSAELTAARAKLLVQMGPEARVEAADAAAGKTAEKKGRSSKKKSSRASRKSNAGAEAGRAKSPDASSGQTAVPTTTIAAP